MFVSKEVRHLSEFRQKRNIALAISVMAKIWLAAD
jgi:hypothetical protein